MKNFLLLQQSYYPGNIWEFSNLKNIQHRQNFVLIN